MPSPLTREQLLAEVARVRLEAAALTVYADELERLALTMSRNPATVETHMHVESAGAKRSAGQFTAEQMKHPFVAMLAKRKLTVADVAAAIDVPRSTIQAWYKPVTDAAHRAIPEDSARAIRDRYGVPLSAWARIKAVK